MGTKGIDCPSCKMHISKNYLTNAFKNDIENYKKKQSELEQREKSNAIKEKELKELEDQLNKTKDYIENDLKKKQSKWDMQFAIDIKNHKAIEYYDVIVCIDSILGIESGWKVKYSEKGKGIYEKMKNKELVKVGVVGLRNKGKSWILQKFLN